MNKLFSLSTLLLALLVMPLAGHAHCGGKHSGDHPHCLSEEPPPPPPPAESCANAAGDFPAFAYTKTLYAKKRGSLVWSGHDLYLADSTGTCAIKILTLDFRTTMRIKYRQNGDHGRIIWYQYTQENLPRRSDLGGAIVKLLDFTVSAGEVSNISHTVAWRSSHGGPEGIYGVALSPDGNTAYYAWGDNMENESLHSIDLSNCNVECNSQLIPGSDTNDVYSDVAMNSSGTRLYFSQGHAGLGFVDFPTSTIRYIAKIDHFEPDHPVFSYLSVGQLLSSGNEAVAINFEGLGIDIIDVGTCTAEGQSSDCLSTGESTTVRTGIPGGESSFFSDSWLLVGNEGTIDIVDIDTLESTPYVVGNVGTPDSAE